MTNRRRLGPRSASSEAYLTAYALFRRLWLRDYHRGAPDNETIAHLSVDLGSRGTAKIQTLPAIPLEALTVKLNGEQQLGR